MGLIHLMETRVALQDCNALPAYRDLTYLPVSNTVECHRGCRPEALSRRAWARGSFQTRSISSATGRQTTCTYLQALITASCRPLTDFEEFPVRMCEHYAVAPAVLWLSVRRGTSHAGFVIVPDNAQVASVMSVAGNAGGNMPKAWSWTTTLRTL
jgi:hypothetical protein